MRGETKIRTEHRARTAVIYVRQSTLAQVRDHTESTARQYALAGEASRLGWPAGGIEVIDTDLGVSGRSTEGRDGFKALVARVCLGEVGAIFGLEVSRLARSSADLMARQPTSRPRPPTPHRRAQRHTNGHAHRPPATDLPARTGISFNNHLVPT
jgi:hypothetical protein